MGEKHSRMVIYNASPFDLLVNGETRIAPEKEETFQTQHHLKLNLVAWKEPPLVVPLSSQDHFTTLTATEDSPIESTLKYTVRLRPNPFDIDFHSKNHFLRVLTYNTHLFKGSTAPIGAVITSVASKSFSLGISGAYQHGLDRVLYDDNQRSQELIKYLLNSEAHVIGLQEVWASDMVKTITNGLSSKYPFHWSPSEDSFDLKVSSGLLLLSKFPILCIHVIKYKHLNGDCSWANKSVACATVNVPFHGSLFPIRFSITHAGTDVGGHGLPNMKQLADSVKDIDYPAILLGDFNVKQVDYDQMDTLMKAVGCQDAHKTVHPELGPQSNTVDIKTNKLDQFFSAIPGSLQTGANRIDYIYFKNGNIFDLIPKASHVIKDWKYDSLQTGVTDMDVSDHYPVLCDFQLKFKNNKKEKERGKEEVRESQKGKEERGKDKRKRQTKSNEKIMEEKSEEKEKLTEEKPRRRKSSDLKKRQSKSLDKENNEKNQGNGEEKRKRKTQSNEKEREERKSEEKKRRQKQSQEQRSGEKTT